MSRNWSRHFGWRHRVVALATLALVVSPALRDHDSFPLSTYPMYAGRGARESTVATAIGVDDTGTEHLLSLATIARTDDPLIAESAVAEAIRVGRAADLCTQIAARASAPLVRIDVVDERHDVVARTSGRDSLIDRRVLASCPVSR